MSSFFLVYHKEAWKYYQCRACGLVSLRPRPSNKALLKSYDAYLPTVPQEIACWAKMIAPIVNYSADFINRRHPEKAGRLLDIGCGYGFFLKKMAQRGWQVEGIEVSPTGREYAEKELGLRIHAEPLENIFLSAGSFDVVTLFYVIEHVPNPKQLLLEVNRILKPGGLLLLRWPHSTPVVKVMGPFSKKYDVFHTPYHLYDFNPKSMKQLLLQSGFQAIETMIGGHTMPKQRLHLWSSVFFGGLAEFLYRATGGRFLLPGVSKTTIAFK
jgi:SAM-dependent methyltransferase